MWSLPGRPTLGPSPDVVVVGAGIIGCSAAYYLAAAGHRVVVIERSHVGAGPSHVAPGMLSPQVEAHYDDAFFAFTLAAREAHAALAEVLREEVGLDVEYWSCGVLRVAADEAERAELRRRAAWQQKRGLRVDWLEPGDLGEYEPLLRGAAGRRLAGGLWFPDEAQVRAARLVQALARAGARRGVVFHEGQVVEGLVVDGDRVSAARVEGRALSADHLVLTAGVGSAAVARSIGLEVPVQPVKGQVMRLATLDGAPRQILWSGHCYLVPRVDGEVVLGATEEDGNDDPRPTLAGVGRLSEEALELVPGLGTLRFLGMEGGLRPATPDRFPVIGRAPGQEKLIVATGHFRGGILMGPLTGQRVAALVAGEPIPPDIAPFGVERFALAPAYRRMDGRPRHFDLPTGPRRLLSGG